MAQNFAQYLATKLTHEKGYVPGDNFPELASLKGEGRTILALANMGFVVAIIVDKETHPLALFSESKERLIEIGKQCHHYAGRFNATQLATSFVIYEVGRGQSEERWTKLKALDRIPGLAKVQIITWQLDLSGKTARSGTFMANVFRKGWLVRAMNEPRKDGTQLAAAVNEKTITLSHAPPYATYLVAVILLFLFGLELMVQVGESSFFGPSVQTLILWGGEARILLSEGHWYRLLTASLLHADWIHLLCNLVCLVIGGKLVENLWGSGWLLSLFGMGALGGAALSAIYNDANVVSVGASGAIMGLFAAALVGCSRLSPGTEKSSIQVSLMQVLIPSLIPVVASRHGGKIDIAAHVGGAIVGVVLGFVLLKLQENKVLLSKLGKILASVTVLLYLVAVGFMATHFEAIRSELNGG